MPAEPPDPLSCPICNQGNECAEEARRHTGQPQPPCWCTRVSFTAEVLSRVPADSHNRACICPACAGAPAR